MKRPTNVSQERGVALVLALLLVLLLSTLAAALMFVTNTEVWSAMNYRTVVQSRYAAEAGVQATIFWLSNNVSSPTLSNFTLTSYPVGCNNTTLCSGTGPVVLSAISGTTANYPDTSISGASPKCNSYSSGLEYSYCKTLGGVAVSSALPNATYSTSATLLRMSGTGLASWMGGGVLQTWQITSQGSVSGLRSSTVQVVATFQNTTKPIFTNGIVATATGCSVNNYAPVYFNGKCETYASSSNGAGPCTDSYNSNNGPYTLGTSGNNSNTGGDVTSNGYINLNGGTIDGNIYSSNPTLVSSCSTSSTGQINEGGGTVTGSLITQSLPSLPCPWGCSSCGTSATACGQTGGCCPPGTSSTTSYTLSTSTCNSTGTGTISGCYSLGTNTIYDGGTKTTVNQYYLAPGTASSPATYGNLTISGADVVILAGGGTYNINSIDFSQDGQFVVQGSGPATVNITGAGTLPQCGGAASGASGCGSGSQYVPTAIYDAGNAGFNLCNNGAPGNVGTLQQGDCDTGTCSGSGSKTTCTASPAASTPSSYPITGIPSQMQIVYAGTAQMRVGGAPNALVIYMPNSPFYQPGAAVGLNGSIVSATFVTTSNSPFHYDSALQNSAVQVGPFKLIGFSWSKY